MSTLPRTPKRIAGAALAAAGLFTVAACGDDGEPAADGTTEPAEDGALNIVASTAIWADLAEAVITDDSVTISSILDDDTDDPHHYEPSAKDISEAKEADLVIVGGGGYDAWLYESLDEDTANIVHPLPLTEHDHDHDHGDEDGHDHDHDHDHEDNHDHDEGADDHEGEDGHDHDHDDEEPVNEHIWYDTDALRATAQDIADQVTALDDSITVDPEAVGAQLDEFDERIAALPQITVAQTEPVADYLVQDSPVEDATPDQYKATTLAESEPSAAEFNEFLELINDGGIDALIFNPQTAGDQEQQLLDAAEEQDLPVIEVVEVPPAGENFFDFFASVLDSFEEAGEQAA
ncbi:metal ABC transporter solute-binding protein, Zn/Mn family [Corynebacterium otitidis]|uniref:metal ABC transporter solute-binding protein, Zn/Mn family n=1 Tax=Corynebacterium otitidis TaxID=29321 RepID=UPI000627F197|nr:zinc ABC transporter substrate-binding protein [Corynebacterium otitidis]KKO84251.1 zinc/manganese transporter substrate-binding protein [Corynebacterium otitidis]